MGDNGLLEGEHGMVDKRTAHEPSIRIPLLVRHPSLGRGKVVEQQTLTVDIAPSLLDLCGVQPLPQIHGKSWVKMVKEGDPSWRTSWLYEYNYEKQFPYTPNVRAIRTDRWKYIRYPHGDGTPDKHPAELYDLEKDPEEIHNLAALPDQAARVADLQKNLSQLLSGFGLGGGADKMPLDEGIKKELPDQKIR
jgi:N-acetylglucosamine-6-sulfatase